MCYKKNGPRCTPQARAKLARAKQRVVDYQATHPNARFDESAPAGSQDAELTKRMLCASRFQADCETSAGGRQGLARLGTSLKADALAARAAGDDDADMLANATRDVASRWQDASKRDKQAKAEENERRRLRYAAKKDAEPEVTEEREMTPAERVAKRRAERVAAREAQEAERAVAREAQEALARQLGLPDVPDTPEPGETSMAFAGRRNEIQQERTFALRRHERAVNPAPEAHATSADYEMREGESFDDRIERLKPFSDYEQQQREIAEEESYYKRRRMTQAMLAAPKELDATAWEHPKTGEIRVYLNHVAGPMVGLDGDRNYEGVRLSASRSLEYHDAIRTVKPYATENMELRFTHEPTTPIEQEVASKITNYWNNRKEA